MPLANEKQGYFWWQTTAEVRALAGRVAAMPSSELPKVPQRIGTASAPRRASGLLGELPLGAILLRRGISASSRHRFIHHSLGLNSQRS